MLSARHNHGRLVLNSAVMLEEATGAICVRAIMPTPTYVHLHPSVHDALFHRSCDTHTLCTHVTDRSQHGLPTNGAILSDFNNCETTTVRTPE